MSLESQKRYPIGQFPFLLSQQIRASNAPSPLCNEAKDSKNQSDNYTINIITYLLINLE
jgi:hypothetical protein